MPALPAEQPWQDCYISECQQPPPQNEFNDSFLLGRGGAPSTAPDTRRSLYKWQLEEQHKDHRAKAAKLLPGTDVSKQDGDIYLLYFY